MTSWRMAATARKAWSMHALDVMRLKENRMDNSGRASPGRTARGRVGCCHWSRLTLPNRPPFEIQQEEEHAVFGVRREIDAEHGVQGVCSIGTGIEGDAENLLAKAGHKLGFQASDVGFMAFEVLEGEVQSFGQAHDANEVFGAPAHGALLAPASDVGTDAESVADVEES